MQKNKKIFILLFLTSSAFFLTYIFKRIPQFLQNSFNSAIDKYLVSKNYDNEFLQNTFNSGIDKYLDSKNYDNEFLQNTFNSGIDKYLDSKNYEKITIDKKPDKVTVSGIHSTLANYEVRFKNSGRNIEVAKIRNKTLKDGMILERYKLINGFFSGIHEDFPGSGYIDFHKNNLIVLSARGIIGYTKNLEGDLNFNQIKNNIDDFIGIKQFNRDFRFSIKDLEIIDNMIYVSYIKQYSNQDCYNTSFLKGEINTDPNNQNIYSEIKFKKLYSPEVCINSSINPTKVPTAIENIDAEFNAHQSGGRIIKFDDQHLLLSLGDFRLRYLAQDENSVNGKLIKYNTENGEIQIISMGHRNPQGLLLDEKRNFILETEHGPMGGDEINLIKLKDIKPDKPLNFGWAIASYGEHYGGKIERNIKKYKKYPLYKSHNKYGFIEPLKSFVPSIGISEIAKISKNKYIVSSLKARSIFIFEVDKKNNLKNLERIEGLERIRDLKVKDNNLYLFLEDSASIGKISLENL